MKITSKPRLGFLISLALLVSGCVRPISVPALPASPVVPPLPSATIEAVGGFSIRDESTWPPPALVLRQALAQQLGLAPRDVALAELRAVTFPDACLAAGRPNELCAAVETPGYVMFFDAAGGRYVYHTDAEGNAARLISAPPLAIGAVALEWRQTDAAGECRTAAIGAEGVGFGPCAGVQMGGIYGLPSRRGDLEEFAATYAPFAVETPAGDVTFHGRGARVATPAEQRMVAEWARLVALEAEAGRSGASWGLALAWNLEGGNPQRCASVTIYVTGEVFAADCAAEPPQTLLHTRLAAAQLQRLYTWLDTYQPFERILPAPGAAGETGATVRIVFSGSGAAAGEEIVAELNGYAEELWARAQSSQ